MLLITSIVVWIVFNAKGYYRAWGARHGTENLARSLITDAVPASVPVIAFLVLSRILDHSGQTTDSRRRHCRESVSAISLCQHCQRYRCARRIHDVEQHSINDTFGGLQSDVAHLHGLPVESIIAAQAAGSAYGNAIGPANVVLGTSITGIKGQEGAVLRQAMPWTILVAVLTGLATVALVLLN